MQLELDVALDCVEVFCYLGDMIEAGGGAGEASRVRVRCALEEIQGIITYINHQWGILEAQG